MTSAITLDNNCYNVSLPRFADLTGTGGGGKTTDIF